MEGKYLRRDPRHVRHRGFCGYKCTPHFGLGMVGLVQAGEDAAPPDLAAVKLPGKEKASMTELVEQAGEAPAI